MKEGHAYELYKKYGTCLRGMQEEGLLDEAGGMSRHLTPWCCGAG